MKCIKLYLATRRLIIICLAHCRSQGYVIILEEVINSLTEVRNSVYTIYILYYYILYIYII